MGIWDRLGQSLSKSREGLARTREGLTKTREEFLGNLRRLLPANRRITPELYEELESALLAADLGMASVSALLASVREAVRESGEADGNAVRTVLQSAIVLVDPAGRLHTKSNLMDELRKIKRTLSKAMPGAPHEVWLVLDATVGQNGLAQARQFHEALGVTGVILTKLDGTAKGGIVVAISDLGLPVRYIGIGEGVKDLEPFDPDAFAEALLGQEL